VGPDGIRIDAKVLKAALARTLACATLEELGRLCDGEHAGGDDERVARHVAGCLRCRTELALLKQFDAAVSRADEEPTASWITARLERDVARMTGAAAAPTTTAGPQDAARGSARRRALRAIAAGLAVAAAALLLMLNLRGGEVRPPPLSPDVAAEPAVFRSNAVTLLGPADDLDEPATALRWEAVPGAASYSVRVMEVDRNEVWKTEARQPGVPLPLDVRARMVPGKPLLWHVIAKDAAGKIMATSQVQRFRLRVRSAQPTP
jgi:hypothetical protein